MNLESDKITLLALQSHDTPLHIHLKNQYRTTAVMDYIEKPPSSRTPSSGRRTPFRAASRGISSYDINYVDDVDEDIEYMDDVEDTVDDTEESESNEGAVSTDDSSEYIDHIDIDSAHPKTPQPPGSELNNFNHNSELLQRLNFLVDSGCLSIRASGRIELDDNMLPVVKLPGPTLSELFQIQRHLGKAPGLSSSWVEFREELKNERGRARAGDAAWTYHHVHSLMQEAYQRTSADAKCLGALSKELRRGGRCLDSYDLLNQLPAAVCRLCGIPVLYFFNESDWQTDLAQKLFEQDKVCYTQVDMIFREFHLWVKRSPGKFDQALLNMKQLIDGLLEYPKIKLQESLLDTTLFRTLSEKAGEKEL
ncbi:hypothetical protein QQZ08_003177 [Neonectria magnoliae]|uniref:Uncharacterized protein n=1 Tax=Neonectria magnoliae TaxID=2732573 RepID=A0ABR1IBP4_9HYPO